MDWFVTVSLFLLVVAVSAKGPPQIQGSVERRHLVRSGENVRLVCPIVSDPPPIREWTKDGESIHAGWNRYRVRTNSLRIKEAIEEDTGVFICKATNGFGTMELKLLLYVYPNTTETLENPPNVDFDEMFPQVDQPYVGEGESPRFSKPEQMRNPSVMKPAGSTVRLRCKATGRPRPIIRWYKGGELIPDIEGSNNDPTRHERWTLVLQDVNERDNGAYTCKVSNPAGSINFTYTLEVVDFLSAPIILEDPKNKTVQEGEMVYFQCRFHSEMAPKIQWLKRIDDPQQFRHRNATIPVNDEHFVVINTSGMALVHTDGSYLTKLQIQSTKVHDSGMYICWGANTMGFSFRSAFLVVEPDPFKRNQHDEGGDSLFNPPSLLLIVGLPALVVIIVIAVTIYCLQRKRNKPSKKPPPVRQTRSPAQAAYPPPQQEKFYEHQYAALQTHPTPQPPVTPAGYYSHQNHQNHLQVVPSREPIVKNYGDISRSDVSSSVPKSVSPNPSVSGPGGQTVHPPQPLQHTHYHYHPAC